MHLSGGNPFLTSDLPILNNTLHNLEHTFNLHLPLWKQYITNFIQIITFDWRYSFFNSIQPLDKILLNKIIITFSLALPTLFISLVSAIAWASFTYFSANNWIKYLFINLLFLMGSLPTFILSPLIFLLLVYHAPFVFSNSGLWYDPLWFSLTLLIISLPYITMFAKILYLDLLTHNSPYDYFSQLKALGFPIYKIIWINKIRLFLPINKYLGVALTQLLSGFIIVEDFFRIPGLGSFTLKAIHSRDYPVILISSLIFSLTSVLLIKGTYLVHHKFTPY